MKKLIYVEDNFLDSSLCEPFIDLFDVKKEDRSLDAVTHSDPNESLTYIPNQPFDLNHPSKEGWRLRYACIEGPEVGVYYRGRLRNQTQIALPYYWKDLVNTQSISVQIQPIRAHQDIIVKRWDEEFIYLQANGGLPIDCFYHVYAERKDINPLHVEYEGETWEDYPDPKGNDSSYAGQNTWTR